MLARKNRVHPKNTSGNRRRSAVVERIALCSPEFLLPQAAESSAFS